MYRDIILLQDEDIQLSQTSLFVRLTELDISEWVLLSELHLYKLSLKVSVKTLYSSEIKCTKFLFLSKL